MKKKFVVLLVIVSCFVLAFALSACTSKDIDTPSHTTHSYVTTVIDPTCEEQGYTLHKCSCGDEYKDNYTDPSGHQWDIEHIIEKSTCTKDGIKEIECAVCHITKNENILAAHSWSGWISLNDDFHIRRCDVCQEEEIEEHAWENNACTICSNKISGYTVGLKYSAVEDNNKIVAYCVEGIGIASDLDIVIPSEHNALPVISIKANAFKNCDKLTSISLPNSMKRIDSYAFYNCSSIKNIIIPNSVENIGYAAFSGCSALQSLTAPFVGGCMNLSGEVGLLGYMFGDLEFSNSIRAVQFCNPLNIDIDTKDTVIFYIPSGLTKITVTNGNIAYAAFSGCENLTNIIIQDGVKRIGAFAFSGCINIVNIDMPKSITYVGYGAFDSCNKLKFSNYNNGKYYGSAHNPYLVLVDLVNASVTSFVVHNDTKCTLPAFMTFSNLSSLVIPDGITSVARGGQINGDHVEFVNRGAGTLKNGFIYIGNTHNPYLVLYCNRYWNSNLTIENTTKVIADDALCYNGYVNTTLTIPDNVQYIGKRNFAFSPNVQSAKKVIIGSGVIDMDDMFYNNSGFTNNCVEYAVSTNNAQYTSINGVLYNKDCTALISYPASKLDANFTVPITCKIIYPYAFYCSNNLKSIKISDNVIGIGAGAFARCKNLISMIIPNSVKSFGKSAFSSCNQLIDIYFEGDIVDWCRISFSDEGANPLNQMLNVGANLYVNDELISELVIPSSIISINKYAFYGCYSLTEIVVSDGVIKIGYNAFNNCKNLISLVIPKSVTIIKSTIITTERTTIYCETTEKPEEWIRLWKNGPTVVWDCKNNDKDESGYVHATIDGIQYRLKDGKATAARQPICISGNIIVPLKVSYQSTTYNVIGVDKHAFQSCINITSIELSNNIKNIEERAFSDCSNLISMVIPNGIKDIGIALFMNCSNLINIDIPDSVTSIGQNAFYGCSSLTSIQISNNVTSVGTNVFDHCNNLTIYCEAASKPSGWNGNWNCTNCPVIWNYNNK